MDVAILIALWLNVAQFAITLMIAPDPYAAPRTAIVFTLVTMTSLWTTLDVLRASRRRLGMRVMSIVSVTLLASMPFAFPSDDLHLDYPPFLGVLLIGVVSWAHLWGPRTAVLPTVLMGAVVLNDRHTRVGVSQALVEAIMFVSVGMFMKALFTMLHRIASRVEAETESAWRAHERAQQQAQVTRSRRRWDALVHDKVLGSLLAAERSPAWSVHHTGQSLAQEAVNALREFRLPGTGDFAISVRRLALGHGLTLTIDNELPASTPDPVRRVLTTAVGECLTNIARHARSPYATIAVFDHGDAVEVVVSDHGVGFDARSTDDSGLGMTMSVDAILAAHGGHSEVSSMPGQGTRVRMWIPTTQDQAPSPSSIWTPRAFRSLWIWALVAGGAYQSIGLMHWPQGPAPWAAVTGLFIFVSAAVMAPMVADPDHYAWWWPAAMFSASVLLSSNVTFPATPDWGWWWVGMFDLVIGSLAFRCRLRTPMATAAAIVLGIAVTTFVRAGEVYPAVLLSGPPQLFIWIAVLYCLRRGLDSASREINSIERDITTARSVEATRKIEEQEYAARTASLATTVLPMLHRLTQPVDLTDAERRQCRELEAAARDHLAARVVVTDDVALAVHGARARGATVHLTAPVDEERPELSAYRTILVGLAGALGTNDRLRAVWRPRDDGRLGTISVSAAHLTTSLVALARYYESVDLARVTNDDDSVLVEVIHAGSP